MLDPTLAVESPIRLSDEIITLDTCEFKICTVSKTKSGIFHRKIVYAHFDGEDFHIVIVDLNTGEITSKRGY